MKLFVQREAHFVEFGRTNRRFMSKSTFVQNFQIVLGVYFLSARPVTINEYHDNDLSFLQLDMPFSIVFYKWMLGQEHTLTVCHLADVVPDVYKTIVRLQKICLAKVKIENDTTLTEEQKTEQVETCNQVKPLICEVRC